VVRHKEGKNNGSCAQDWKLGKHEISLEGKF